MDDGDAGKTVAGAGAIGAQPRPAGRQQTEGRAGVAENDGRSFFGGEVLTKASESEAAKSATGLLGRQGIKEHPAGFIHFRQIAELDRRAHEDDGALKLAPIRG